MTASKSEKYIIFQAGAVIAVIKNMVISTAVKSRSTVLEANIYLSDIFFWIFENQEFNIRNIWFRYHENQTNKQKTIITTYKEFLGTCLKSKKQHIIQFV